MAWKGIDGRGMTIPQFEAYIKGLKWNWRPSGMVLHNTAAPTLAQWSAANALQRIKNLEHYYKNQRGWSSGPHAFVDDNLIWVFTPFNTSGTHSPSFNGTRLGIEMVGDFSREDDDSGRGLKVKMNTVALFAIVHAALGLDPDTIKLHKEDPRTTHDCPGKDIEKAEFIQLVKEYMGEGGDHDLDELPITRQPPDPIIYKGVVNTDGLNLREGSSASSKVLMSLNKGVRLDISGEAMNGNTKWLRVKAPALSVSGWVAARYVNRQP